MNYKWAQLLEKFNFCPKIAKKVNGISEEKIRRNSLVKYREELLKEFKEDVVLDFYTGKQQKRENLEEVLIKCIKALKDNGILYCSFKYGDKEINKEDRYLNYINEDIINKICAEANFKIIELYKIYYVRNERATEIWLNILLKFSE